MGRRNDSGVAMAPSTQRANAGSRSSSTQISHADAMWSCCSGDMHDPEFPHRHARQLPCCAELLALNLAGRYTAESCIRVKRGEYGRAGPLVHYGMSAVMVRQVADPAAARYLRDWSAGYLVVHGAVGGYSSPLLVAVPLRRRPGTQGAWAGGERASHQIVREQRWSAGVETLWIRPIQPASRSRNPTHMAATSAGRSASFQVLLRQPCPAMARSQPVARHSLATLASRTEGTVQRHVQATAHARRAGVRMSLMPRVGRPTWLRRRTLGGGARPRRAKAVGGLAWLALRCCGRDRPRGSLRELPGAIPRSEAIEAVGGRAVGQASSTSLARIGGARTRRSEDVQPASAREGMRA